MKLRAPLCASVVLLLAGSARAADAPASYALSWVRAEGAEECPNGRVVMTEVERRLGRAVFDAAAERAFEVEVTRFGSTYRSDVFVRDAAGRALGHRTLQSDEPGCGALLSATALAIALVIDPEASAREAPAAGSAGAFEVAPSPPPRAAPAPPPTPTPPATFTAPIAPPPPPHAAASTPHVTMSLRGELGFGLVPATSPGLELAFGARPWGRWGFALRAAYELPRNVRRGPGSLDVGLTRASGLLTFELAGSERVRLSVGAGPALGALHVAVREPAPVTRPGDFWFLALEAQPVLQVHGFNGLFFELGGSVFVPLRRQEFLVRGQAEPVWSEPALAARGFVGLGALFP